MITKSHGKSEHMARHFVQHVKPEFMIRLRKKVSKLLKCQVIPQSKYMFEKKKGNVDICMCENICPLTQGRCGNLKGKIFSRVIITS